MGSRFPFRVTRIHVGAWHGDRTGLIGREWVQYEAPVADRLKSEMRAIADMALVRLENSPQRLFSLHLLLSVSLR